MFGRVPTKPPIETKVIKEAGKGIEEMELRKRLNKSVTFFYGLIICRETGLSTFDFVFCLFFEPLNPIRVILCSN